MLPSLVGYFCNRVWKRLADTDQSGSIDIGELDRLFEAADADGDGRVDLAEMVSIIETRLGYDHANRVLAQQVLSYADANQDGSISRLEMLDFFSHEAEVSLALQKAEAASAKIEYS